jgi:hypothetical protein
MYSDLQRKKYQPVQTLIQAFEEAVKSRKHGQETIIDLRSDITPKEAETINLFQEYLDKEVNKAVSPFLCFGYSGIHVSQKAKHGYPSPKKSHLLTSDLGRPLAKFLNWESNTVLVLATGFSELLDEQKNILQKSLGSKWNGSGVELKYDLINPFLYDGALTVQENADLIQVNKKAQQTLIKTRMTLRRLASKGF